MYTLVRVKRVNAAKGNQGTSLNERTNFTFHGAERDFSDRDDAVFAGVQANKQKVVDAINANDDDPNT